MAISHTVLRSYKDQGSTTISLSETISANAEINLDDAALAVITNKEYDIAFTRANLQSICLYASGAVTIKTNSSGSPVDTIVLTAGQTRVWTLAADALAACPFSADVTKIFVTNAGAGAVAFKVRGLVNQ